MAKEVLEYLAITTSDETNIICSAIHNHSSKNGIHSTFDEILVDAAVLQHCLFNSTFLIADNDKARYIKLVEEFELKSPDKY